MSALERIKGELQPLLSESGFNDNNFAKIEQICKKYLENDVTGDPVHARREAGIYLLYHLIGDLRDLWHAEQPLVSTRRDALKDAAWEPFRDFARAVLAGQDIEHPFQAALKAVLLQVDF